MKTEDLVQRLKALTKNKATVVLCIGNKLRGDDGAGPLVASKLRGSLVNIKVIDCNTSPEDFVFHVVDLMPEVVIFVNAVDVGLSPGAIVLKEFGKNEGKCQMAFSTHNIPLLHVATLIKHLIGERGKNTTLHLLGIQVSKEAFQMSRAVREGANQISELFKQLDPDVTCT